MPSELSKCKLPEFTPDSPHSWFNVVESLFIIHKVVKEEERFALVLSSLPAKEVSRFESLCALPAEEAEGRYGKLKVGILAQFDPPLHVKYQNLVSIPPLLPGQRPSELLHNMLRWLPAEADREHFLVRQCFLSKLPVEIQNHCRTIDKPVQDLAAVADTLNISNSTSFLPQVCAVTQERERRPGPCRLHAKFGRQARRCAEPGQCSWSAGNA
jgi:hypothetical protein